MRMTNTFPQVAKVGMNESECRTTKCKVKTILVPLSKLEYVKDDKVGFLKLLVDKKMSKADLRKASGIAPNTMTKMRRDEEVTLSVLGKICKTLDVDYGDIMEFVDEGED